MPFADEYFDRVRADRAIQHMQHPEHAIEEMERILCPGGFLTLVEPDWGGLMLYPASPAGGEDDEQSSAHAHVLSLSPAAWPDWSPVACPTLPDARCLGTHWGQAVSYTHTSWRVADTVCQIGAAVRSSTQEDPSCSEEMGAWLRALEVADLQGAFLASIPLFFAVARKCR